MSYLQQVSDFFEIDPATFSIDRVSDVRNGKEGSVGFSVRLVQSIGATPVEGAILQVGLADDLGMISLSCINVIREGDPTAKGRVLIDPIAAEDVAIAWASAEFPDGSLKIASTELTWLPRVVTGDEAPELCYGIVIEGSSNATREKVFVSATDRPEVVLHHSLVFSCGGGSPLVPVSGTVMAETEEYPGSGHMAVEMIRMRVGEVGSSQGAETSMNGFFSFNTAGMPPHSLRFTPSDLANDFEVMDESGLPDEILQVSGTGQQITLNAIPTEEKTAVYNVFSVTQAFKDFLNMIGPGYPDFNSESLDAGVNYGPSVVPHGDAFYSGGEIMFSESGSGFENMAFESVIVHELGHWVHSTPGWFQGTIGNNGLQEGLADTWAMYFTDQSLIGRNYAGPGTFVRDGVNTAQWCRNSYGGCNLDPHEDGLPLMGALWEFYSSAPVAAVELLPLVTSTNSFGFVDTRIRDLWIAYDDDDQNLLNGTPNYALIEQAFLNHGWEPFGANAFGIQHDPLPDSTMDMTPFDVFVDVSRNPDFSFGNITSVELTFSTVGSVGQITVPMTLVSGDTYTAQIPAIASPVAIQYSISVNYVAGPNSYQVLSPPIGEHSFRVGITRPLYYSEFEAPSGSDQGWTHGDLNNPSFDDWQREEPGGNQGVSFGVLWVDPETPATANTIWGTDIRDTWDGAYRSGVNSFLESPEIDATGAIGLSLAFDRWASCAPNDELRIVAVSPGGQSISLWDSPVTLRDEAWSRQYIELPPVLDGQVFRLRFELESDSGNNYGGWGIDNVEVTSLIASPSGASPSDTIACSGETSYSVGQVPILHLDGGTPNGAFEVRVSLTLPAGGWLSSGHLFDLGPNFVVVGSGSFDSTGSATYAFPAATSAGQVGSTFHVEVVENGPPVQDSNYLSFKVWP